jgi:hypothetical protein
MMRRLEKKDRLRTHEHERSKSPNCHKKYLSGIAMLETSAKQQCRLFPLEMTIAVAVQFQSFRVPQKTLQNFGECTP